MALKAYINGSMKKITKQKMTTFIGGVKKHLPKGVTFINGEKVVLWSAGELTLNTWILSATGYPNSYSITSRVFGMVANDNKIVFNVGRDVSRSNVENISSPYTEGTQSYGVCSYYKGVGDGKAQFDSNSHYTTSVRVPNINPRTAITTYTTIYTTHRTNRLTYVNLTDMEITADTVATSSQQNVLNVTDFTNAIYTNNYGYSAVTVTKGTSSAVATYNVSKNMVMGSATAVATINATGYNAVVTPVVWSFNAYDGRYILFGGEYKATANSDYIYRLYKVDLSTGSVTTLLDNQTSPILSIMVDGNNIIITTGNKMIKMNKSGTISATYTSPNVMPTLIGKYNGYYYLTTTRDSSNRNFMNIEIVSDSNFSNGEVKQFNIRMVGTYAFPQETQNGYLCFATKHYISSNVTGTLTTATARTATLRETSSASMTEDEVRICRLQCY